MVSKREFMKKFKMQGILRDDERIVGMMEKIEEHSHSMFTKDEFFDLIQDHVSIVESVLEEKFIVPKFKKFRDEVREIYESCRKNKSGKLADYIPELANQNPNYFGVSVCTVDGQRLHFGDSDKSFSVQSTCKPINYCLALET